MTIENDIQIIELKNSDALLPYWNGIADLFEESFGKPLSRELWEWAYLSNPYGEPVVSIAVCQNRVVGHYAVVPLRLRNSKENLSGYLSMTTMVAKDFRRFGLFQTLANSVYEYIESLKEPSVVLGFPNDNSAPGFKKRLGWTISEEYAVVQLKPENVTDAYKLLAEALSKDGFKMDLSSDEARHWRESKPNQMWSIEQGIGIKTTEFGRDFMYFETLDNFENSIGNSSVNIVLPSLDDDNYQVAFPYRFGYRAFNCQGDPTFIVEMCMSDVF